MEKVLYQSQDENLDMILFWEEKLSGENEDEIKEHQIDETVLMFADDSKKNYESVQVPKTDVEIKSKSLEIVGKNKRPETERMHKCEKSKLFLYLPKLMIIIVILISGLCGLKFSVLRSQKFFEAANAIEKEKSKLSENLFEIFSEMYKKYDLIINEKYVSTDALSLERDELLGMWSGSYIGMSNQKKIEKSIDIYIGDCDETGKVKGVVGVENGDAGYYYFEGVSDYVRGTLTFERKKWLSPNPDRLKKLTYSTTYDRNLQSFSGYIVSDPQRKISFIKTESNPELIQYWEKRKSLMRKYN